jgi:phospholipase C
MIEWRWGLSPLSVRDAAALNLAHALQLNQVRDTDAPQYVVPPFTSAGCTLLSAAAPRATEPTVASPPDREWDGFAALARGYGFDV